MNASYSQQKPALVTAIALMTLASGIINLFWGYVASATALGSIVFAICLPVTILPTILGVFEIIYGAKLLSAQPQPVQPSNSLAVFQILTSLYGNVFSLVAGILILIFYNDLSVREYFARLNQITAPTPKTENTVTLEEEQNTPAPLVEEVVIVETTPIEEQPKPKRSRKIA